MPHDFLHAEASAGDVRQKLPYLRVLVPGRDSSVTEALLGALGWTLITSIVGWWLLSWVLAGNGDWSDFFIYVVLSVATALWTGESWFIFFRAWRRQRGLAAIEPSFSSVQDVR